MYSDKDKQREAVREATKRYRLRKGITKVSPEVSDTRERVVIPKAIKRVEDIPKTVHYDFGVGRPVHHPTCKCLMCRGK
jgi:fibronectin type 3 domain-containing protein